jgi:predicted AlkP superfamily pyrophosphatase or phosphodiesterase
MYRILALFLLFSSSLCAQNNAPLARPKLVVGIVIDQMRYDYWYRYYNKYSANGFKRLLNDGFNCRNHYYNYALTVTAAGHASVYTGSIPAIHGIIGNEWYDQKLSKGMYCVADSAVQAVGTTNSSAGKMSPKNLLTSTITDQLRISSNFQSKTIGVAIKDRGAILPAGHTANGAYWFDGKTGNWISSTFYGKELPQWVKAYNEKKRPAALMEQGWNTLLPIAQYTESTDDDKPYEAKIGGAKKPIFPYELVGKSGDAFGVLAITPHGNTLTKEIALEALKNENLGKGAATDFLAVSFSTPDYVGHSFGPNSIESEDTYLRLDLDLAEMMIAFDNWVGKGNYTVFLTADHGVMDVVDLWQEKRLPAGRLNPASINNAVKTALKDQYGEGDFIKSYENYQFYLNYKTLRDKRVSITDVLQTIRPVLLDFDGVADMVNLHDLSNANLNDHLLSLYKNGNHAKRSGDIQLVTEPGWMSGSVTATHGSPYNYDAHIPLLFYGWGVAHGETFSRTQVEDTAPTLAAMLKILEPSGNVGKPIKDLFKTNEAYTKDKKKSIFR